MRAVLLSTVLLLGAAGAAHAQSGGAATLQSPLASPARPIIDGAQWRCTGATCVTANQGEPQPALRACKRFAAQMGAVSAFTYAGRAVTAEQLAECNTRARQTGSAAAAG